jgi:hypothetical protein
LIIDRLDLSGQQKEVSSWSFLLAGLFGGFTRMGLVLLSALSAFGLYASLGEVVFITIGTLVFIRGQVRGMVAAGRLWQSPLTTGGESLRKVS